MDKETEQLNKDAEIYGLGFLGDAAMIKKAPLVNVLASGFHIPAFVINVVDCTKQLEEGEKKDGPYIAKLFTPTMKKVDPLK